jgi:TIR domain
MTVWIQDPWGRGVHITSSAAYQQYIEDILPGRAPKTTARKRRIVEPKSTDRRLKVFLSYSSKDTLITRTLYQLLRDNNVDPWMAKEDILPGKVWADEIWGAMSKSDAVVMCLSRNYSLKSSFIRREVRFALDIAVSRRKQSVLLIPAKFEECSMIKIVRHLQWVNLFEEGGNDRLLQSLFEHANSLRLKFLPKRNGSG